MIVAGSAFAPVSIVIAMPATKPVTLPTLMLVVPVGIETGQRAEDPARGVRDQDRVLVVAERPVVPQEVHQVRHLLQIRREVRPVAEQVRVVELQVDDVLDLCAVAVELAALLSLGGRGGAGSGARDTAGCSGG